MALEPGTRLGVYEIRSALGAGGMGEVYRARDTRLQRDVALKILPEAFASDAERLARFEREAQVLAALDHPHIGAIHGLEESGGARALVLELVEGDTLAERIARGPLPLDEVLTIARQIADALEAAHERGIVHRDLKPSNVKVRPDGTVKVLDFGLAKLVGPAKAGHYVSRSSGAGVVEDRSVRLQPDLTQSPTITTPAMTQLGVILGTAAYMSPEQAKGREADKRSDIWAFGALLYEMLTGRRAFEGEDISDTLASVFKSEPDWTRLPADVPPAIRTLLQRCLTRDRRQRISDIAAARFVLTELHTIGELAEPRTSTVDAERARFRRRWIASVIATAVVAAIAVGATAWFMRSASVPAVPAQFSITLPEGQLFSGTVLQSIDISPDGTQLAYSSNSRIYLRPIGDLSPRAIPGSEAGSVEVLGVSNPMFSPDGQNIAFFSGSATSQAMTVKRIAVSGGTASTLAVLSYDGAPSGSWGQAAS